MSMQVSEKEIEIDRLKTTVQALNGKVEIVDDHLNDVHNARSDFKISEQKREEWQAHMIVISETV